MESSPTNRAQRHERSLTLAGTAREPYASGRECLSHIPTGPYLRIKTLNNTICVSCAPKIFRAFFGFDAVYAQSRSTLIHPEYLSTNQQSAVLKTLRKPIAHERRSRKTLFIGRTVGAILTFLPSYFFCAPCSNFLRLSCY